jgi:serine protease Do
MLKARSAAIIGSAVLCALPILAETVKDRAGAVLADRSKMEKDARWIYNDWRKGFEEAKARKKPLLVVMRCVPCLACAGIDAGVLTEPGLEPLLDQFICVRVINANAIDLSLFQFDYDLSFSSIIFNGDGTVYGRYGSWTHQKNSLDKDTAGLKRALESALAIHHGYPANKKSLEGKQGTPMPVTDPLKLPELAGKYRLELDWEGKIVQSCVHCHQVGDAIRTFYRDQSKAIPREWVYPMPPPETIGLTLAPDEVARVQSVSPDSIAAKAGLKSGDDIVSLNGQTLISIADVSWVLHHAPEKGFLKAQVKRGSAEKAITVDLPQDWRLQSDISRRVGTWGMRAMAEGGLLLEELSPEERKERDLDGDKMALFVKHAGEYGKHAAAKKAGFQKGDVLVSVDGISGQISESELIGRLLEKHQPGDNVKTTVLRGKDRIELSLPIQ